MLGTDWPLVGRDGEIAAAVAAAHRAAQGVAARCSRMSAACPGARPIWLRTQPAPPSLTRRENEMAQLAADGLPSRAIADRLGVSVRTVDSHLYRVYAKLGVRDRAGLARTLRIASGVARADAADATG